MLGQQTVLIIDADTTARESLELTLLRMGIDTLVASSFHQATKKVAANTLSLCLTESGLEDASIRQIIDYMQQQTPPVPVAVVSNDTDIQAIVTAVKLGAINYTNKPAETSWLGNVLQEITQAPQKTSPPKTNVSNTSRIIGESPVILKLKKTISKLARSQVPVYIEGESGSGKELVAHEIHHQGSRNDAPFIPVNCGAIPENLMESEFFGHKKGSFTGANADKQGLFQAANGGTLFLDEVADLPLAMQVKLLRAIQEGSIKPVGATEELPVDVRILSATHKPLEHEVDAGNFRQDLYYRLNVIQLDVPPLRERQQDILRLSDFFLQKIAQRWQLPVSDITDDARSVLSSYSFPGNVRELENILERACTLCDDDTIQDKDLKLRKPKKKKPTTNDNTTVTESVPLDSLEDDDIYQTHDVWNPEDANAERDLVSRALDYTRWNRTRAARILGMTFRQLSYRIQKYGLDEENIPK